MVAAYFTLRAHGCSIGWGETVTLNGMTSGATGSPGVEGTEAIDEAKAWAIVRGFAADVAHRVSPFCRAVAVIGPLGAGRYRPGLSDIDTTVILRDDTPASFSRIVKSVAHEWTDRYALSKEVGALCLRANQLRRPYDPRDELVPEIVRLKHEGHIIEGSFNLATIDEPRTEDFVAYARVFYPWLRQFRTQQPARTPDTTVDCILAELRLAAWFSSGEYVLDSWEVIPAAKNVISSQLSTELDEVQRYLQGELTPTLDRLLAVDAQVTAAVRTLCPWSDELWDG